MKNKLKDYFVAIPILTSARNKKEAREKVLSLMVEAGQCDVKIARRIVPLKNVCSAYGIGKTTIELG